MSLPFQSVATPAGTAEIDNMAKHMFQEVHVQGNFGSPDGGDMQARHFCGNIGTAPTAVAGANAGTAPPAPVVTAGATDTRGNITFGTGTTPAAGAQVVVTFNAGSAYPVIPVGIMFNPLNTATQALGLYVSAITTTGFTLSCTTAPAASQANTIYSFNYLVVC